MIYEEKQKRQRSAGMIVGMIAAAVFVVIIFGLTCQLAKVDADEEGVFTMKPWFFGKGGVSEVPLSQGSTWKVFTTDFDKFKITPIIYTETFNDDAFSDDNTPLNVTCYITLQIQKGHTPKLIRDFGREWYANNVQVKFRTLVRGQLCEYSMYDLVSNRECLDNINVKIFGTISKYVAEIGLPIDVITVDVNKVKPNAGVLNEMNNTAVQIQAKQTQIRQREMEIEREKTETQRAMADKAYQKEMGLSSDQFIQLQWIDVARKNGANIDVIMDGQASRIWNVRR